MKEESINWRPDCPVLYCSYLIPAHRTRDPDPAADTRSWLSDFLTFARSVWSPSGSFFCAFFYVIPACIYSSHRQQAFAYYTFRTAFIRSFMQNRTHSIPFPITHNIWCIYYSLNLRFANSMVIPSASDLPDVHTFAWFSASGMFCLQFGRSVRIHVHSYAHSLSG